MNHWLGCPKPAGVLEWTQDAGHSDTAATRSRYLLLSMVLLRDGLAEGGSGNPAIWDSFALGSCLNSRTVLVLLPATAAWTWCQLGREKLLPVTFLAGQHSISAGCAAPLTSLLTSHVRPLHNRRAAWWSWHNPGIDAPAGGLDFDGRNYDRYLCK